VDFITGQRLGKQVPAEMSTHTTIEEKHTSITIEEFIRNDGFCWGRPDAIKEDFLQLEKKNGQTYDR
jgi:hypothetical protein